MTTTDTGAATAAPPPTARDRGTYGGMLAVAVAAAVLSFSALAGLAELAGVTASVQPDPGGWVLRSAWLLPIAVDAYAVTATRVWLRTAGTARTRGYARRNAIGAIGLSVAGNAAYHALTAAGVVSLADVTAGWAVIVAVSAVPPVMLGLVGHLHALVSDDHRAAGTAPPASRPATAPTTTAPITTVPLVQLSGTGTAPTAPSGRTGTRRPARTGSRTGTRTGRTGARTGRTDVELTAALAELPREPDGTVPIRRVTAALGCGPDRARRLLAAADLLRTTPAPTTPAELMPAATTDTTATTDDPAGDAAPIAA